MSDVQKMRNLLFDYFTNNIDKSCSLGIGMEVETPFVDSRGVPITLDTSQTIFKGLLDTGWSVVQRKGPLIAEIKDSFGNRVLYELGRQNIELATRPMQRGDIIQECRTTLESIYGVARNAGAYPLFEPILNTDEDLLVVPDERDATWVDLDGRKALQPLAHISSVQFTIEVPEEKAIVCINNLGKSLSLFLNDYPQDHMWRQYIQESHARYERGRYGGPKEFDDINDYCWNLGTHRIVTKDGLQNYSCAGKVDLGLFIRSVWWYFRLRRYGNKLCIEVRPIARRSDEKFETQLATVLESLNL